MKLAILKAPDFRYESEDGAFKETNDRDYCDRPGSCGYECRDELQPVHVLFSTIFADGFIRGGQSEAGDVC